MAISPTGPVSFNNLRTEFGIPGGTNISLNNAFGGSYCVLSYVNRNTASGQNIYSISLGASNYSLSDWRGYNETAPITWSYLISNNTGDTYSVGINLGGTNILGNSLPGGNQLDGTDVSTGVAPITTPYTANLKVSITVGPSGVDVNYNIYDPDTGGGTSGILGTTPIVNADLGDWFYYQRFTLELLIG